MQLVEEPIPFRFIQNEVTCTEVAKGWRKECWVFRTLLATRSDADVLKLSIRFQGDDAVSLAEIVRQLRIRSVNLTGKNFNAIDYLDRCLGIQVKFAKRIDLEVEPLESDWSRVLP